MRNLSDSLVEDDSEELFQSLLLNTRQQSIKQATNNTHTVDPSTIIADKISVCDKHSLTLSCGMALPEIKTIDKI